MRLPKLDTSTQDIDFDKDEITFNTEDGIFTLKITEFNLFKSVVERAYYVGGEVYGDTYDSDGIMISVEMKDYAYLSTNLYSALKNNLEKITHEQ